jgi:hypothetical protein
LVIHPGNESKVVSLKLLVFRPHKKILPHVSTYRKKDRRFGERGRN